MKMNRDDENAYDANDAVVYLKKISQKVDSIDKHLHTVHVVWLVIGVFWLFRFVWLLLFGGDQ